MKEMMGEKTKAPLTGIRVIDFCQIYAGPFACSLLGTLGAEVIRVESQARPPASSVVDGSTLITLAPRASPGCPSPASEA